MTKARTNASASPAVGRNMIINGAMNVAQRSASVAALGAASGYFTCDRWLTTYSSTAGRLTMSQTADGPNGISANCIKLDCTTADTSIAASEVLILRQVFEGQNLQRIGKGVVGAKQITVSFYVKASAAFDFVCELVDLDNSRHIAKVFSTTTDWNRIELTFVADVDDGSSPFDDDNAASFQLNIWLHGGSTFTAGTLAATWATLSNANRAAGIDSIFSDDANNFFLTGVQMEVGPVATEFEQEDISTTLAKCQRYCNVLAPAIAYGTYGFIGFCENTTTAKLSYTFPVTMRAAPTLTRDGTFGYDGATSNPTIDSGGAGATNTTITSRIEDTISSGTQGEGIILLNSNDSDATLTFDAEL